MDVTLLIGILAGFWLICKDNPKGITFNMIALYMVIYWGVVNTLHYLISYLFAEIPHV